MTGEQKNPGLSRQIECMNTVNTTYIWPCVSESSKRNPFYSTDLSLTIFRFLKLVSLKM